MNHLALDIRQASRSLVQQKKFTALVVLTLAIGIGSTVGMFAYLTYFVWPTVVAPEAEELVFVSARAEEGSKITTSYADFLDLERQLKQEGKVDALAAHRFTGISVAAASGTFHTFGQVVSADYFPLFGQPPLHGRWLGPSDDRPGAERVVVLHYELWNRRLQADPSVIGQRIRIDGRHDYTVVGITRPRFEGQGIASGAYLPAATADWLPERDDRDHPMFFLSARLADGVDAIALQSRLDRAAHELDASFPREKDRGFDVAYMEDSPDFGSDDPMAHGARILTLAVGLLLMLACANVGNLMLARTFSRRREMSVRAALGASRGRLARQLLIEALLLSAAGGLLGLALSERILRATERYLTNSLLVGYGDWAAGTGLHFDPAIVGPFAATITAATALLFAFAPLLHTARLDLVSGLKTDEGGTQPGRRFGVRQGLLAAQVALSIVLLTAAVLLGRTFWNLHGQELGFEVENRSLLTIDVPEASLAADSSTGADTAAVDTGAVDTEADALLAERIRRVVVDIESLPGVEAVGPSRRTLLGGAVGEDVTPLDSGGESEAGEGLTQPISRHAVGRGYFRAMGMPVLRGRTFDSRDHAESPPAMVISHLAAEALWPGADPVGRGLRVEGEEETGSRVYEVIGVVGDIQHKYRISETIAPHLYTAFAQEPFRRPTLVVHGQGPVSAGILRLLRERHPEVAIVDLEPAAEQVRRVTADYRMNADFAAGIGLVGLFIAALGIFSVLAYSVGCRTREFGIRAAIGATHRDIERQIFAETARIVGLGAGVGLAAAFLLSDLIEKLLYGVAARDPMTFAQVVILLALVAFAAAWLPARRAAAVEPMHALRDE